jgi:hypothetical protein
MEAQLEPLQSDATSGVGKTLIVPGLDTGENIPRLQSITLSGGCLISL